MPKYVKVQGTWKAVDESADCGKIKVNGVWRTVSNSYVKVANVWKAVCAPAPVTTTTTTTTTTPVTTTTTTPVTTTTTPVTTATTTTTAQAYPNISSATAYGAGAGQVWTSDAAYITWSGSGWGSYTVIASNGSSSNSPSSAGGPPVLLTGFSASTTYSVTVTLFANANYSGQTASASTSFTTAAAAQQTLPTPTFNIFRGWQVYPNSVYATFNITNFDTTYTSTYSSSLGTRNIEFPEEYIAENLTPNQSYTVSITVSKPGFTSATGTQTFTADPAAPQTTATTTATTTTTPVTSSTTTTTTTTTTTIANCGIMPSVIGLTESAAATAITERGIAYEYTEYTTVGATAQNNGYVQSQSPGAGTYVGSCNFGYNATLVLYSYTAPTTATTSSTTTTTTTTNCQTCNSYSPYADGTYDTRSVATSICPSGSQYYRVCVTPGGCPNIDQTNGCVPVTTTTATTTTIDCNTCNSYNPSSGAYSLTKADASCPDTGTRYYRVCITPGACPNIEQNGSCVPPATTSTVASTTTTAATTTACDPKFRCKSYDVVDPASTNYYDCYTVNACTAPRNPDGSRASCCA
jgi:hypothetical protein